MRPSAPCRKELPVLAVLAKKVGPDHLKIIAINYDDASKPFRQLVEISEAMTPRLSTN